MKRFKNILFVAQAALQQDSAITRAVALAESNHAKLTVVDVVPFVPAGIDMPPDGRSSAQLQSELISLRRKELESLVEHYRQRQQIDIVVLVGEVFIEVVRAVLRDNHDLVVKCVENPSYVQRLFGSVDMHLLRKCPAPVWLVRPEEKSTYRTVLAAVDFRTDIVSNAACQSLNQQILDLASSIALSDSASLHVVHVWDVPAEMTVRLWADNPEAASKVFVDGERSRRERALNQFRDQLRDHIGQEAFNRLSPQFHLSRGEAVTAIPEMASKIEADLVVMGTVARTGIAGLLIGNTAESILEQLQSSVLAVKPDGFVSPVKIPE